MSPPTRLTREELDDRLAIYLDERPVSDRRRDAQWAKMIGDVMKKLSEVRDERVRSDEVHLDNHKTAMLAIRGVASDVERLQSERPAQIVAKRIASIPPMPRLEDLGRMSDSGTFHIPPGKAAEYRAIMKTQFDAERAAEQAAIDARIEEDRVRAKAKKLDGYGARYETLKWAVISAVVFAVLGSGAAMCMRDVAQHPPAIVAPGHG